MHDFFPLNLLILHDTGSKWINLHRLTRAPQNTLSEHYDIVWCSLFEKEEKSMYSSQRVKNSQLWFNFPKPQLWT